MLYILLRARTASIKYPRAPDGAGCTPRTNFNINLNHDKIMKSLFVIMSNVSLSDIKDLTIEGQSWTDKNGIQHTVGAFRVGNKLVRETKDGRMIIQQIQAENAQKQPKKVAKGVK